MSTYTCDVKELPAGAGRCIRVARWSAEDGQPIAYAVTQGFEADREVWDRVDRGCEIPPNVVRDVLAALAELAHED